MLYVVGDGGARGFVELLTGRGIGDADFVRPARVITYAP
jgi:hypothetical protein